MLISTNNIQEEEKIKELFSDSLELNQKQIDAILADDDVIQIVAGAGTGKTTTIVAKIKYLIETKDIKPEEILCLSYTVKSCKDIEEKLKKFDIDSSKNFEKGNVRVTNFHSFGRSFFKNEPKLANISGIFDEFMIEKISKSFFTFGNLKKLYPSLFDKNIKDVAEEDNIIKKDISIFKNKKFRTIDPNVIVRCEEDFTIANILFLYSIDFKYGYKYKKYIKGNKYLQFDFYLPEYDIYIENMKLYNKESDEFNIIFQNNNKRLKYERYFRQLNDRLNWFKEIFNFKSEKDFEFIDNNFDSYFPYYEDDDYLEDSDSIIFDDEGLSEESEELIEDNGFYTDFEIKNYEDVKSFENTILYNDENEKLIIINSLSNKDYINDLVKNLEKCGVDFDPILDSKIEELLRENKKFLTDLNRIRKSFNKRIEFIKEHDISKEELKYDYEDTKNKFISKLFLDYLDFYNDYFQRKIYIDYFDMINEAMPLIEKVNYKYIFVDEYQDISQTRYNLLKKVKDISNAKLVVVGDDWQSIYSFAGSDVKFFKEFKEYFNHRKRVCLDETYRSSNELTQVAKSFIDSDELFSKELFSKKHLDYPLELRYYTGKNDTEKLNNEYALIYEILRELSQDNNTKEVMVLCRYEKPLINLKKKLDDVDIDKLGIKLIYNTIHGAKGLDAQNVIIMDINKGHKFPWTNGFPNKRLNDGILPSEYFFNTSKDKYSEEKRLFYVALTRSKNKVYLCADKENRSGFIDDLLEITKNEENSLICKEFDFSDESNPFFSYKSLIKEERLKNLYKRTKIKCPKCEKGFINVYSINDSKFISCSDFDNCGWFIDDKIDDEIIDNLNDFEFSVDGLIKSKSSNDSKEDLSSKHPEDTNMPNKNNENSPETLDDFF